MLSLMARRIGEEATSEGMAKRERSEVLEEIKIFGEPRRMLEADVNWATACVSFSP